MDQVFHAIQTIKGSGAMLGFEALATFALEVETVFDAVRTGKLAVSRKLVELALESKDLIRTLLDGAGPVTEAHGRRLVTALRSLQQSARTTATPTMAPTAGTEPSVDLEAARS